MEDHSPEAGPLEVVLAAPEVRGRPVLAWLLILVLVSVVIWVQQRRSAVGGKAGAEGVFPHILEFQSKYVVAAANLLAKSDPRLGDQLDSFPADSVAERLRVGIVAGELQGPEKARERLRRLEERHGQAAAQALVLGSAGPLVLSAQRRESQQLELAHILDRVYADLERKELDIPSVTQAERDRLQSELGWFGDLALAPAGGPDGAARDAVLQAAYRVFFGILGAFALGGVVGLAGILGLLVFFIFLCGGRIPPLIRDPSGHSGVYAETFAVWLLLFLGLGLLVGLLPIPRMGLLLEGITMLASAAALGWPVLRGIPWKQVRQDIGLTLGRRPLLEPFAGLGAYVMAIPLVILSALVTMLLLQSAFGPSARPPSHPVAEAAVSSNWWVRAQLLALACIAAPLIEEIFFRGVLYRHLREVTHRWGNVVSVLGSAGVVSFIFAIIHPQGIFGVPMLMSLAFAFSLAREWRETLVPSMVAHALTNGVTMILLLSLLGN